ncbi:MAG TPA: YdcF family protein [Longimicrobiaceae bacterium]|nr:YdcF family protein [Longimicrobiaceae bacterium]
MLTRFLRGFAILVVLLVVGWAVELAAIYLYGQLDQAEPSGAIVVLGAAQYDGRPSPVLRARLEHAIALHRRGIADTLIMTGGTGAGDTVSEAMVGKRFAVRAGIPESVILVEEEGLTSLQSMQRVARIMQRHGLRSAVLVSDPFHMLRLRLLAIRVGIRARSSPTRSSPISRNPAEERRHILRESLSLPFGLVERTS